MTRDAELSMPLSELAERTSGCQAAHEQKPASAKTRTALKTPSDTPSSSKYSTPANFKTSPERIDEPVFKSVRNAQFVHSTLVNLRPLTALSYASLSSSNMSSTQRAISLANLSSPSLPVRTLTNLSPLWSVPHSTRYKRVLRRFMCIWRALFPGG